MVGGAEAAVGFEAISCMNIHFFVGEKVLLDFGGLSIRMGIILILNDVFLNPGSFPC